MNPAILFDMDGVLVDTAPFHFQSWQLFGQRHGLMVDEEFFRYSFGRTNDQIFLRLLGRPVGDKELMDMTEEKEAIFRQLISGQVKPAPGLMELIHGLVSRKFRIGVGSSAPRENVVFILAQLGLDSIVQAFTCCEEVEHGKPDPEVFLKTAERLGASPRQCVVVEDALVGIEAAHRAGMKCIAITTTHPAIQLTHADLVIHSFEELTPDQVISLLETPPKVDPTT